LRERGSRLVIRRGPVLATLHKLVKENGATAVFWNRRYEPAVITRDAKAKEGLNAAGLEVKCFNAGLATARARQWRWPGSIAGRCPRRNTRAN
jgi:deoxyribodipyrimidine photo-lyase